MTGTIWEHRGRHLAGDGNYLIGGAEAFLLICRLTSETSICPVWISLCAFYLIFLGFGFWVFECHMLPPTSCFFIIFPGSILCVASHTSIFSLWGPPLCETNTNTMSWSWGKVIKQLSISSRESIDNHLMDNNPKDPYPLIKMNVGCKMQATKMQWHCALLAVEDCCVETHPAPSAIQMSHVTSVCISIVWHRNNICASCQWGECFTLACAKY